MEVVGVLDQNDLVEKSTKLTGMRIRENRKDRNGVVA